MTRIRFKVDNRERLWTLSILQVEGMSLREYVELLLTHLCAPDYAQPMAGGETPGGYIQMVRTPVDPDYAMDPDPGEVSIRWPEALIAELQPALEAADLPLPAFLSTLWAWAQCPDDQFSPALKARLNAFANQCCFEAATGHDSGSIDLDLLPWNAIKQQEDEHV